MHTIGFEGMSPGHSVRLVQPDGGRAGPRSVLIGTESLLLECATILENAGHQIVAVVSKADRVADWARARRLPMLRAAGELPGADTGPIDYLFSITNLSVLPAELLALPRRVAINFHDGPLPDYAGLNTPIWALLAGENRHGVTWHMMTADVDRGDVLESESFAIDEDESALSINTKCLAAAIQSFGRLVRALGDGTVAPVPQDRAPDRCFGRADRPPAAAAINWKAPAEDIARFVRALDFGTYANPLGSPKARIGGDVLLVGGVQIERTRSGAEPGTVVEGGEAPLVATGTTDVRLTRLTGLDGRPPTRAAATTGDRFDPIGEEERDLVSALDAAAARHEPWWRARLAARDPLRLPHAAVSRAAGQAGTAVLDRAPPHELPAKRVLVALIAYLGRLADKAEFDLGFSDPVFAARHEGARDWFARVLPLRVRLDWRAGVDAVQNDLSRELREMHRRIGFAADLAARSPELKDGAAEWPTSVQLVGELDDAVLPPGGELTIAIAEDGRSCRWLYDPNALSEAAIHDLASGFLALLASSGREPGTAIADLDLLHPVERAELLDESAAPARPPLAARTLQELFVEQAARTPDRVAVTSRGASLTYRDLDARSNRLARHLQARGVGPGTLVGIHLERSIRVMIALIAVHKAGAAYLPLDPAYPADRIAHMIADSGTAAIVTQASVAADLPPGPARIVDLDRDRAPIDELSAEPVAPTGGAGELAYVIYTSGSTGRPKGVMIEHAQLLNFFAGMDEIVEPDGTWLAATSLSFDISVLELLWTVARGYHVVIATGEELLAAPARAASTRPVGFSLFYFASADGGEAADQYRLLLEGAKFADAHGFEAVWTPERHFHAFGGLYPNPAVTGAAIAAITSRIAIRAGSVVAPLHHPVRIAEEWSLVDNLSNGRVGVAFASGWQPNDFVLRPENFADRSGATMRALDDVRALWRGEKRGFPGPLGEVEVGIYPRPVQPELPVWITSAGNPDTFAAAGRAGANVLTHLLGQTVEEVAGKLAVYRDAWRAAGHPGEGHVTIMLHTLVGEDGAAIRDIVRGPLIEYLRTSTNLVKQYAWFFPAFKRRPGMEGGEQIDLGGLGPDELDALLEHAFERYYETSGLFGSPEDCAALVDRLRNAGVDEIGCLIDFGVPVQQVLDRLPALDALRRQTSRPQPAEDTLPALMVRHGVTHLQCTPSLARMLVADPAARSALGSLKRMMVGGEAFPPDLASELRALVGGAVMNMYGPTETTIWSAVHELNGEAGSVPLGRPLANQQIHILDGRQRLVRPGTPGEIVIGGEGVGRGYLHRPELTAERFIVDPFRAGARAYRTGDMARRRPDGALEFLGRVDHQVKIRGHRIELGEIEAALTRHPQVDQAVVVADHRDEGDARLAAFIVTRPGAPVAGAALREHLRALLPEFMLPGRFVRIDALPRTANGKIDRGALPAPDTVVEARPEAFAPPTDDLQRRIADIWCEVLKLPRVGVRENFFDLGGHSLLAVQAHRRLSGVAPRPLALTDIFRFPTVESLGAHLSQDAPDDAAAHRSQERAQNRRAAMQRRRIQHSFSRT